LYRRLCRRETRCVEVDKDFRSFLVSGDFAARAVTVRAVTVRLLLSLKKSETRSSTREQACLIDFLGNGVACFGFFGARNFWEFAVHRSPAGRVNMTAGRAPAARGRSWFMRSPALTQRIHCRWVVLVVEVSLQFWQQNAVLLATSVRYVSCRGRAIFGCVGAEAHFGPALLLFRSVLLDFHIFLARSFGQFFK
jgi:hypothetical protein